MNPQTQSSFNNSTSFFEKLLYKDLLADFPNTNTQDEDASTMIPESRSTSCKSELGKNFNPFAIFATKYEFDFLTNDLKAKPKGFNANETEKSLLFDLNQKNEENNSKTKRKTIRLKNKVVGHLNQNVNQEFRERFKEVEKFQH